MWKIIEQDIGHPPASLSPYDHEFRTYTLSHLNSGMLAHTQAHVCKLSDYKTKLGITLNTGKPTFKVSVLLSRKISTSEMKQKRQHKWSP